MGRGGPGGGAARGRAEHDCCANPAWEFAWACHMTAMPIYTAVHIRDLADPYWTLMRENPAELLRSEYRFETQREAEREAKRLSSLTDDSDA